MLIVEQTGLQPEAAVTPDVAATVAAFAVDAIQPWHADHDEVVAHVLSQGPRLFELARLLLAQPGAAWWFAGLDRSAQLWIGAEGRLLDLGKIETPTDPPTSWERYAQKSARGLYTSTAIGDLSSMGIVVREGVGDFRPEPPYTRYLLHAAPDARVFEVAGPQDWHALCATYPAEGEAGRVVPDWSAVARDWDAVHLTLGGLLTAEQVKVGDGQGWTAHGGWDAEQTLWLRQRFEQVERWTDMLDLPSSELDIAGFWYWRPDRDTNPMPGQGKLGGVVETEPDGLPPSGDPNRAAPWLNPPSHHQW